MTDTRKRPEELPKGRCRGCGYDVQAEWRYDDGTLFHTGSEHACDGTDEACWRMCPVPVECGPIRAFESAAREAIGGRE